MNRALEHLAALSVILFFIPFRISIAGSHLYLADIIGLIAIGLLGIIALRGQLYQSTLFASGFIFLFIFYIFLSGLINQAPFPLITTEVLQWLSVISFVGLLHQIGYLSRIHFLCLISLYAFCAALYTAIWHLLYSEYPDFKQLENTKYLFGFSCAFLYLMRKHIRFSWFFLTIAIVMLILSQERKALLSFIIMIIVDKVFCHHSSNKINLPAFTFLGFGFFSLIIFLYWIDFSYLLDSLQMSSFDLFFADQFQTQWDSNLWRKLLIANGFSLFLEHPIFGVGAKMLPEFIAPYFHHQELVNYTHNFMLDVAIEYGLVGVSILLGGALLATKARFKQRKQNPIAFLFAVYILTMVFFVAVNSTVMLMFILPFFINIKLDTNKEDDFGSKDKNQEKITSFRVFSSNNPSYSGE